MSETDGIEVIIPKEDWERLKIGDLLESEGTTVIFSPAKILHYMFGDKSEEAVKVRISKIK